MRPQRRLRLGRSDIGRVFHVYEKNIGVPRTAALCGNYINQTSPLDYTDANRRASDVCGECMKQAR